MKIKLILTLIAIGNICMAQTKEWPSITMVNDVIFKDTSFNQYNIGCGFLLLHNDDTLAITAKHILGMAHTDKMKTTNFENGLKQWKMYPRDKKDQIVISETLLNEDKVDSVNFDYIGRNWYTYNDYLVFKISTNNANVTPVKIRKAKPKAGEHFFVVGWSYWDTEGEQRIYEYEYVKNRENMMLMDFVKAPEKSAGLSGSPVLDFEGNLVGVVSGFGEDPETKKEYMAMCDIAYLKDFLKTLKLD